MPAIDSSFGVCTVTGPTISTHPVIRSISGYRCTPAQLPKAVKLDSRLLSNKVITEKCEGVENRFVRKRIMRLFRFVSP